MVVSEPPIPEVSPKTTDMTVTMNLEVLHSSALWRTIYHLPDTSPLSPKPSEADSHAGTFVASKNCVILSFTDRMCDVQPYSDDYAPVKNVPIVTAATGYTSATGMNYILIFPDSIRTQGVNYISWKALLFDQLKF
jgi:hypothetical protein